MAAATITTTLADNTTDIVYTKQEARNDKGEVVFMDLTNTTLVEPRRIGYRVDIKPPGARGSDRITLFASKGILDDSTGVFNEARLEVRLVVPRTDDITTTHLYDLFRTMACWIYGGVTSGTTNLQQIVKGVIPEGDFHCDGYTC